MRSGALSFNVRIATGLYAFDDDFDVIMDAYIHEGWRKSVRNADIPGVCLCLINALWIIYALWMHISR